MSALEQALADYLDLRHSLGHDLAEAGWLLPSFVAYLEAHGLRTVTVEAALAWAQHSPTGNGTERRAAADDGRPGLRPLPGGHRRRTPKCRRWG